MVSNRPGDRADHPELTLLLLLAGTVGLSASAGCWHAYGLVMNALLAAGLARSALRSWPGQAR